MRVAALAAGFVLALVTPVTSTAAYIDSNDAVSAETQMNGGGCYPPSNSGPPTEQLNLLNPEWAAIDVGAHLPPESDPVALHGTVVFAKINEGGDDPGNHDSDDQNTLIDVDAADMGLVATGNIGSHGEEAGPAARTGCTTPSGAADRGPSRPRNDCVFSPSAGKRALTARAV